MELVCIAAGKSMDIQKQDKDGRDSLVRRSPAWREILLPLFLIAAVVVTFFPVLQGEFVRWDDDLSITGNPNIRQLNAEQVKWAFTDIDYMRRYVPLVWLNWAVLHHFFGYNPFFFHLQALLLHALNAALVFWIVRRVMRAAFKPSAPGSLDRCAAIGALLWALHPLRAEVVAWATGELYPQSTFFLLASLLCYLRWAEKTASPTSRSRSLFWFSLLLFTFSLLTYPIALAFVGALLILDVYPLRRLPVVTASSIGVAQLKEYTPVLMRLFVEKVPFIMVTLAVAVVSLWARANMSGVWAGTAHLDNFTMVDRIAQAFYVWAYYIWKSFVPFNLSPVYTQLVSFNPGDWPFLLSGFGITAATALLLYRWKRWPGLMAAWLAYLALMVPMLGLTEHPHFPNDRYGYLPSIIGSVVIAGALWRIHQQKTQSLFATIACLGVACLLGVASFQQAGMWKNTETLFKTIIARLGTDSYRGDVYWRLGQHYVDQGRTNAALESFDEALRILPKAVRVQNDAASLLLHSGDTNAAIARYEKAMQVSPNDPATRKNFALVRLHQGRFEEAAEHYNAAIKADASDASTRLSLAFVLQRMGKPDEAFEQVFAAVKIDPKSVQAQFYAGNACMNLQKFGQAEDHFKAALKIQPDHADAHQHLGDALKILGKFDEASMHFAEAARLRSGSKAPPNR